MRPRSRFTTLVAATGMASLLAGSVVVGTAGAARATGDTDQVCDGLDSGKTDLGGEQTTYTVSAPDGMLIDGYCVKAGSAKAGDGPTYVDIGPVESVTLTHPSGKAISHYSLSYTDEDDSAGDKPKDKIEELDETRKTCEGVESREGTRTTTYTFDADKDEWVPVEGETAWQEWEKVRDLTDQERRKLDCDEDKDDAGKDDDSTVTPVAPSVSESEECGVEGTFTIPATPGVRYLLDGERIKAGEHSGPADGVLTAEAVGDTELEDAGWSYDLRVDEAAECVAGEVKGASAEQGSPEESGGTRAPTGTGPDQVLGASESLPTAVDAGLAAASDRGTGSHLAAGMVAGGLVLMAMAAALAARRQEAGAHEG